MRLSTLPLLFSLALLAAAVPTKIKKINSLSEGLLLNNWAAKDFLNKDFTGFVKTPSIKSSTSPYQIPTAKTSRAVIGGPLLRAYEGVSPHLPGVAAAGTVVTADTKTPQTGNEGSRSSSLELSVRQSKLTFEECTLSSECAGDRQCVNPPDLPARCIPAGGLVDCSSNSDCVTPGEVCARDSSGSAKCVSQKETTGGGGNTGGSGGDSGGGNTGGSGGDSGGGNTGGSGGDSGSESEPCIAVHYLQHLSREELVFDKDRLANVLCDENESCATPGHMVTYQGKGMMMKSYCELVGGCVKKAMHVNSPRYRKGITVPSASEDMVFTAFSARYVTRPEEAFLSAAIRMGF